VKPRQRRFRNILINPHYQLKYVFWLILFGSAVILAYGIVVFRLVSENYSILVDLSPMNEEAKSLLYSELQKMAIGITIGSLVFVTLVSLLGVVVTHRTAGPLFQFKKVFNDIRSGKRGARVKLRPGDEFQDVAVAFNEMMDKIQS